MTRSFVQCLVVALLLSACGSETPRTQVTLMIDADPLLKSQLETVTVDFASGAIGAASEDLTARPTQTFRAPFTWPLVLALVPAGDNTRRAFEIHVTGSSGAGTLVEASARSSFVARKNLALRMRLYDACRAAVFAGCSAEQTCDASDGSAGCRDSAIDPNTLPLFSGVDPSSDAGPDTGSDAGIDSQVPVLRDIGGRVFSTNALLPLAGAVVSLPSGDSATTDADGAFTLSAAANDADLTIEHPEHAFVVKALPSAASVYLEVFVKQVDVRQQVATAIGGEVKAANGTAVSFPAQAFRQLNGAMANGMANVTLASPDTKDPAQAQAFPGDFKATDDAKEGKLSALVALDVTATLGAAKLNLSSGTEAEITVPTKTAGTAQTLDLWSFDTTAREWKKEGTANLTRDSTGKSVYRAKISHLSWWAVGTLIEDTACMHLCATHADGPAAFARATITGIDAPINGSFFADETGCVAFDVPPSTQVSVVVQSIDGVAAPRVVITPSTLGSSDNLSTCDDLGTIALTDRSQTAACPSNWSICGGACTDLTRDPAHCGSCAGPASVCAVGQSCLGGTCGCANNETVCGTQCIDTATSPDHCGTCNTACSSGQRCSQGRCVDVTCLPPTSNCNGICVDLARDGVNGQCPMLSMPECVVPADCPADEMCDDAGACVPIATCTDDTDCPLAYRCDAFMTNVCEVPDCGMVGYTYCRGGIACVDLNNNSTSCGVCGNACGIGERCENGTCMTCPDPNCAAVGANCGVLSDGCGLSVDCGTCQVMGETCGGGGVPNVCGSTSICGDGMVTGSEACDDGDLQNGDGCSSTCQAESGWNCPVSGGPCVLPSDPCDGLDNDVDALVDEDFAPTNCGVTGGDCMAGVTACVAGSVMCVGEVGPTAEVCDGRDNNCDGQIDEGFSLQNDENNCGSCGFVCGSQNAASSVCMAGSCNLACQSGWSNCDGNAANGCETSLNTLSNCGACGNACGTTCNSGVCLP